MMIDILPGMNDTQLRLFARALNTVLEHGYGQITLVISGGRVSTIMPAPSIKVPREDNQNKDCAADHDPAVPVYKPSRKENRL